MEIEVTPDPAEGEQAPEETARGTPAERALRDTLRELRHKEQTLQQRVVELNLADAARELRTQWTGRLTRVTAAIAEAVTAEQVYQAVVDQTAAALGATTAGLWLFREAENVARLCRSGGYDEGKSGPAATLTMHDPAPVPIVDAIQTGDLVSIATRAELLSRYPEAAHMMAGIPACAIVCLPLATPGRRLGALALTFDEQHQLDDAERSFLLLVGRYSGQALERLRLLEEERDSRARAELLYRLAAAVIGAAEVEEIFAAALDAILPALKTERAAVLVYDGEGVMRFRAWRGLSDDYRRQVEGHSPWARDARDPQPVLVPDVHADADLAGFVPLFQKERIGSLGFIPLVSGGRLLGKFMVYYDRPRALSSTELDLARAIANHVAAAVARFQAVAELRQTVHFNETFTAILGHDLRNPLAAIVTSARLAMDRDSSEKLHKPLARILSSGNRMSRMIDQLLDFTRVRLGGGIAVDPVDVDLAAVVRQVMDELDEANPEWSLRLACHGDTSGRWDPDRLSQVFSNLVANAVRHGRPEHGVGVTLDGRGERAVRVTVHNMGAIPADRLPKLFEPLAGGGRAPDNSQGLGLGLFITRELVCAHGGSIEVCSDDEAGTTFTVTLPRG
ncbi:MAG TPA: GAF domain-containing sensor histidine kinase [Polyangia bacterium]|nr:GAF domain-containing sensor histidine kinase [Polyangia bacterium]